MRFKFASVWQKVDWTEIAATIGFPTWSQLEHPCYQCWAEGGDMRTVEEEYVDRLPWRRVTQADYDAACSHCEILITVNDTETLSAIRAALRFDKRKRGPTAVRCAET